MIQFLTYDDKNMEEGKFYIARINKSQATALIEANPSPIHFADKTYVYESWNGMSGVEIWKVEKYGSSEKHTNITSVINWFILKPENKIIINSNSPISGYIRFI